MKRASSYVAALGVIVLIVFGIMWATAREPKAAQNLVRQDGRYFSMARPAGADGPLKHCVVCHSVEADGALRVAPSLHGIAGAPKARAKWYAYSAALAKAGGNWTEADLDKYLASPSKFLPGTAKTIVGIADAKERAEVIAALKPGR